LSSRINLQVLSLSLDHKVLEIVKDFAFSKRSGMYDHVVHYSVIAIVHMRLRRRMAYLLTPIEFKVELFDLECPIEVI